ncbi:hypothetical protein HPB47_003549 [Ixodes persulcatus]|uniref:Uncharacterized protein n=1 Tax=Ixodes persulcatus TaxID=34615 RepID=A0AC60PJ62_IXOPE|nr:hypothetical protein HPB47_003549 [Ixodes persulcatus]
MQQTTRRRHSVHVTRSGQPKESISAACKNLPRDSRRAALSAMLSEKHADQRIALLCSEVIMGRRWRPYPQCMERSVTEVGVATSRDEHFLTNGKPIGLGSRRVADALDTARPRLERRLKRVVVARLWKAIASQSSKPYKFCFEKMLVSLRRDEYSGSHRNIFWCADRIESQPRQRADEGDRSAVQTGPEYGARASPDAGTRSDVITSGIRLRELTARFGLSGARHGPRLRELTGIVAACAGALRASGLSGQHVRASGLRALAPAPRFRRFVSRWRRLGRIPATKLVLAPCGRVSKRLVAPSGGQDTNYWYVPVVLLPHGAGFVFGFVMASAASRPKKRTSTYCCVYDCHNSYINTAGKLPAVKFYRFPGKPYEADRRRKWIAAVRRATTEDAGPSTTVADHSTSEDDQATSVEPPLQEGDSMHAVNAFTQTERVDEVGLCNLFLSVTPDGDASTQVTHAIMTSVAIEAATECASTAVGPDRRSCIFAGYDSLVGKSGALEELCSNLVSATSSWIPNPSSSSVQATMPECFKAHYPKCRYIIDCTEVRTETPATLEQQRALFSNYKGCHTLKFLIAILPNGTVSFVSQAYGGRSSDTYITIDSGFLERIEPGDVVLADKGFPGIKAPVESKHGVMVFPPFSKGQLQFTSAEMEMTYQVAKQYLRSVKKKKKRKAVRELLKSRKTLGEYATIIVRQVYEDPDGRDFFECFRMSRARMCAYKLLDLVEHLRTLATTVFVFKVLLRCWVGPQDERRRLALNRKLAKGVKGMADMVAINPDVSFFMSGERKPKRDHFASNGYHVSRFFGIRALSRLIKVAARDRLGERWVGDRPRLEITELYECCHCRAKGHKAWACLDFRNLQ